MPFLCEVLIYLVDHGISIASDQGKVLAFAESKEIRVNRSFTRCRTLADHENLNRWFALKDSVSKILRHVLIQ
jgi:hypothetical protein